MKTHAPEGARRRVVIYARISDDREGRMTGVDRQAEVCKQRAERHGWEVIAVFKEDDRSAYSGKPRPLYDEMLRLLRSGEADAVLSLAPTRLYRNLKDSAEFLEMVEELGIEVETVKAGRYNLSTADGRRDARRAAIDARHESEQISERVKDAKADNLAAGEYRGGPRPFGYEADGTTLRTLLCPDCGTPDDFTDRTCNACSAEAINAPGSEAWHVEQATHATIAGESLRSICRTLAEQGVHTVARRYRQADGTKGEPESREWQPAELRKLLLRPRNAGLMEHHGEITGNAIWPGIVTEEDWRACKAILQDPARRTTTGNGRVWLGSGLYDCYCGQKVRGSTAGIGGTKKAGEGAKTHRPAYRCQTGGHVVRDAVTLDEYIEKIAVARLSRPDAAELHLKPLVLVESHEDLDAKVNALRAKLDELAADYAEDSITRKQMLDGTARTRARLEELAARMAGRASSSALAGLPLGRPEEIEAMWPTLHLDRRRVIVDALCTVTVNKARRGRPPGFKPSADPLVKQKYFDPDTIGIEWKPPA